MQVTLMKDRRAMNREYHHWYSPALQRDMELLVFGHAGAKVLVFPTRSGRFYEYEDMRVVQAMGTKIEQGHLQLYCVDSLAHEIFYSGSLSPPRRTPRYLQYERYLLDEVMPMMAAKNPHPCVIAHGCSLGAYYAANLAFRHPHLFRKFCGFSGRYDLTVSLGEFGDLFDGYYDDNIYFNTPSHFLPNLGEAPMLDALRTMDIVFVVGKEDPFLENNRSLSRILWAKGIKNSLYEWDGRAHRACSWRKMAALYL